MIHLQSKLNKESYSLISSWLFYLKIDVKISKSRLSKLGDFKVDAIGSMSITINHNLNPYIFLITLTHEIAHAFTWIEYKRTVFPHGKEWKAKYRDLMSNFLSVDFFPSDILHHLLIHMCNPKATIVNDLALIRVLKKYDKNKALFVEDIKEGGVFSVRNGRKFIKKNQLRKRYLCQDLVSKKNYIFHPLFEVDSCVHSSY